MADPKTVLEFVKKNGVKMFDLRFTDLPGLQHHVSYPIDQLSEASFEEGFGMDGSSIRGWAAIHESDMLLMPDPNSFILDPFTEIATLVMVATWWTRSPSSATTATRVTLRKKRKCIWAHRPGGHSLFWGGGRVLYLRQRAL